MEVGFNQFSDLTEEEFKTYHTGFIPVHADDDATPFENEHFKDGVNWITKGAVTPVQNQASCGSCWSFAAAAGMEGLHAIQTGKLVKFSEQQLVECSWDYNNNGCNGGRFDWAWDYHIDHGVEYESNYPYTSGWGDDSGSCQYYDSDSKFNPK